MCYNVFSEGYMKIVSFQIENFRSIRKSEIIKLDKKLIIVGRNNEGKSNYLKAFNIALTILLEPRRAEIMLRRRMRYDEQMFNWERDYPIKLQTSKKMPDTKFTLEFLLNEVEKLKLCDLLRKPISNNIFIDINVNKETMSIHVFHKPVTKRIAITNKEIVCDYISKEINFVYIPAIRTEKSALNIIDSIIRNKLDDLVDDQEYLDAQLIIYKKQNNLLQNISFELHSKLSKFIPSLKSVNLSLETNHSSKISYNSEFKLVVDDGNATEISYKGDGFKSLVAMALLHDKGAGKRNTIIAIEEPEAHLHSGAIHELKAIIDEIDESSQILITTHNQVFVDRNNINNNILIDDGKIKNVKNIRQLREILGVELSENLTCCEKILLVEGDTDEKMLRYVLPLLNNKITERFKKGLLQIMSAQGTKFIVQYTNFYKNVLCDVKVLLDNDEAGNKVKQDLLSKNILKASSIYSIDISTSKQSELEDIIKPTFVNEFMKKEFKEFNLSDFQSSKLKWSEEIKRQYIEAGHPFDKEVETNLKNEFIKFLCNQDILKCIKDDKLNFLKLLSNSLAE